MKKISEVIKEMLGSNGEIIFELLRLYEKADTTDKKILLDAIEKMYRNPQTISVKTKGGTITATVSPDSYYPGIDLEFVPNYIPEDFEETFPRVLMEQPSDLDYPQCFIWADPKSEDPSEKIIFNVGGRK